MATLLLGLHGYTMHGASFHAALAPLQQRLAHDVELRCPDAPHVCSRQMVEQLSLQWRLRTLPEPNLTWWDATDDGRHYRGWELARDRVRDLIGSRHTSSPSDLVLLFGFSQGAILAATLAALAQRGDFPPLHGVVLVAGSLPRAELFQPWFQEPIRIPSLHVWGAQDTVARERAPLLAERFESSLRELAPWPGPHVVPTRGSAADAIVAFITRVARSRQRLTS